MKKILVFLVGAMLLLVAGCGSKSSGTAASAGSPEEATKAYYTALKDGKPEVAYQYQAIVKDKDEFVKKQQQMPFTEFSVGKAEVKGSTATVPVTFKTGNESMPEITISVELKKDGGWKVTKKNTGMGGGAPSGMPGGSAPSGMPPASK